MRKAIKTISYFILFLAILAVGFGFYYYLDGKRYFAGEEKHYVGKSEISPSELAMLSERYTIGGEYSWIKRPIRTEGGELEIEYDFYTDEDYPFLFVAPFSYLDTPLMNTLKALDWGYILGFIVFLIIVIVVVYYADKYGDNKNFVRRAENILWYVAHPKFIFDKNCVVGNILPSLADRIDIPRDKGIYAIRSWKYKSGRLYSVGAGQVCWESNVLLADKPLAEDNHSGLYSNRLGIVNTSDSGAFIKDILGIVSLTGDWYEHADGVLRSESCEMLFLVVSEYHRAVAGMLSSFYRIPVMVADNPINEYINWLSSKEGLYFLKHNARIIKGGKNGNERAGDKERAVAAKATLTDYGVNTNT